MLLHDSPAAKIKTDTFTKSIVFAAGESCNSTGSLTFFSRRATAGHRRSPTADGDISTPRPRTGTGPPRRKVCHPGSPRSSRSHPRSCKSSQTPPSSQSQIRSILGGFYVHALLSVANLVTMFIRATRRVPPRSSERGPGDNLRPEGGHGVHRGHPEGRVGL